MARKAELQKPVIDAYLERVWADFLKCRRCSASHKLRKFAKVRSACTVGVQVHGWKPLRL